MQAYNGNAWLLFSLTIFPHYRGTYMERLTVAELAASVVVPRL